MSKVIPGHGTALLLFLVQLRAGRGRVRQNQPVIVDLVLAHSGEPVEAVSIVRAGEASAATAATRSGNSAAQART
jgi:hypothetical protein